MAQFDRIGLGRALMSSSASRPERQVTPGRGQWWNVGCSSNAMTTAELGLQIYMHIYIVSGLLSFFLSKARDYKKYSMGMKYTVPLKTGTHQFRWESQSLLKNMYYPRRFYYPKNWCSAYGVKQTNWNSHSQLKSNKIISMRGKSVGVVTAINSIIKQLDTRFAITLISTDKLMGTEKS